MVVCKKCGTSLMGGVTYCPSCGTDINSGCGVVVCDDCQTENIFGARFCKNCGKVLIKKEKKIACQECGMDNDLDSVYCTVCGVELLGERNNSLEVGSVKKLEALIPTINRITTSFYDEFAGSTPAELAAMTYVCPLCGKRNQNNQQKCTRCGRDKKRTAELILKAELPILIA